MKNLFQLSIVLLLISIIWSTILFFPRDKEETKSNKPTDWFYQQRAFPFDKLNQKAYREAQIQSKEMRNQKSRNMDQWVFAGPTNIGGRLTDAEFKPGNEEIVYVGTASGGIFKSEDHAETFFPIFDENLSLSIGDIAIAPSNPNILYVGTGEANPGGGSLAYVGYGVLKSIDEGNSWQHLGLEEIGSVGRIVVSPQNSDVAYVAAMGYLFENNSDRGLYKTSNGGDSWDKILFINDSTGVIDLAIHPTNPDTIYAVTWQRVRRLAYFEYGGTGSGIYRSYDGGETWAELQNGLPGGINIGRIGIGISQSDPHILYAIYCDKTGYFSGLFKSEDNGDSWTQTNDDALSNIYASYGWWFGRLKIDPLDPQVVYAIGLDLYKTNNGGDTWQDITGWAHVDMHEVAISAENPDQILLANDGGLYASSDAGASWSSKKQLPITQFYTCAIDNSAPYRLYGGAQDNGTNRTLSGNPNSWAQIYGGDGFYCLIDPDDSRYVYAEYQYGNFARSTNYGSTFTSAVSGISSNDRKNWSTPVVMNPLNPSSLYYGSHRLYKSTNRAVNWQLISDDLTMGPGGGNQKYGTITTISVSAADTNYIYVGSDDGLVYYSPDNGGNWQLISENLPQRWISRVVADPFQAQKAYVCLSGFRVNEYLPHIWMTEDAGLTWQEISTGLPDAPVNDLIVDPSDANRLIVATDVGVFYRDENIETWQVLGEGLPLVPITDLAYHQASSTLVAATFGRSMYSLQLTVGINQSTPKINSSLDFDLYPNPAMEIINLQFQESYLGAKMQIYNSFGKLVLEDQVAGKQSVIILGRELFPNGIYFLQIQLNGESITKKFVVNY